MENQILDAIRKKGLLLEKEVYDFVKVFDDVSVVEEFLDNLQRVSGQKMITKSILNNNIGFVRGVVNKLPGEGRGVVEKYIVKLGLSLEITKESKIVEESKEKAKENLDFKVFYADTKPDKKLEVKDFVGNIRARYQSLQRILMQRPEIQNNLVGLGKLSGNRQGVSFIGIVTEKRVTKNKNLIIKFEDMTGQVNALVKHDKGEVFSKAEELQLDDIVGVKASGNNEILFIQDIFWPDAFLTEKTKFNEDISVAFLSDLHCGSDRHLGKSVENFLEWINGDDEDAKKIKYIFFVGDNVDGVGVFPGQERVLKIQRMEEQYELLASYLEKIPKQITMFMCPGQHDAVRVAEPQPLIDKRYASKLYEIENLVLVTNPTLVKLLEGEKEFKILMYHGASLHSLINNIPELREIKAHRTPAKAVRHLLKRRHLAPTHGDVVYIPNADRDPLVIEQVPDVLCTGEVHRLDVENYNGVLAITGSCWQSQTDFEEKIGNIPDPGKVAVLNLKTRGLKIYDFLEEEK